MPSIREWAARSFTIGDGNPSSAGRLLIGRKLLAGIGIAVLVVTALLLFGDARQTSGALRRFDWWLGIPILILTLWNYGWRFLKWEMYLNQLAIPKLSTSSSLLVFFSAFSMSITPGKVGELIKSVYLRRLTNAPVNRSSAIIAAERITDALALLLLALLGLTSFSVGRPFLFGFCAVALAALVALQRPTHVARRLIRLRHRPRFGRIADHVLAFLEASADLFRPPVLVRAVGLGLISWMGECIAFALVLIGLGVDANWELLLVATFVLALSTLAGGASMLPGGLGVADASVAGMLVVLVNDDAMSRSVAVAATMLIRFATLWFSVLLGIAAVVILERRTANSDDAVRSSAPAPLPPIRE